MVLVVLHVELCQLSVGSDGEVFLTTLGMFSENVDLCAFSLLGPSLLTSEHLEVGIFVVCIWIGAFFCMLMSQF